MKTSIGWGGTIQALVHSSKELWNYVMTVEHSPLKNLDPMVGHMIFQILAFMWSGIFALILGSYFVFGFSAVFHLVLVSGIFITAATFRQANMNPDTINKIVKRKYNGRRENGEHE